MVCFHLSTARKCYPNFSKVASPREVARWGEGDYRDLKGGGEREFLPVEVFRAADVVMFTDGVAFLYFPSVPSELLSSYRTNTWIY